MRISLLLLAGLAAASSPQHPLERRLDGVKIISTSALGTGCPDGTASVQLDATGTIFDVALDRYTVETGPGLELSEARKNCRISLNLQFPSGYQFSVVETRFTGYASIPAGLTGTCRAAYTFSGQVRDELVFRTDLPGSYADNYSLLAGAGLESWSPCGGTTAILNINAEARITPADTRLRGFMTMDAVDGRVHLIAKVNWRRC